MDTRFPRLAELPPYILGAVDAKKDELRARGVDVFDFGLGNPDRPAPALAVEAARAALEETQQHRYQPSPGGAAVRQAMARWYQRRYGVTLDPEREVLTTIGSKEGIGHLFLATLGPGDVVLVPDPCYPIHRFGVQFAGATPWPYPIGPDQDPLAALEEAFHTAPHRAKAAVVNFPHNPTSATVDARLMEGIVQWAQRHDLWLVSDLAYADILFEEGAAPSALAVPGGRERVIEFFTLSKSYNMAGFRVGFGCGDPELVSAVRRIKGYYDYGGFGPAHRAATAVLDGADDFVASVRELYRDRAAALCRGLAAAGWEVAPPRGTMFVWAPLPPRFRAMGSLAFAVKLLEEAAVAVAPGVAFGPSGDGHVRFGLVEEVPRIEAACRALAKVLR